MCNLRVNEREHPSQKPQVFDNLISEVTFSVTSAIFYLLEVSHEVQPLLKERGLYQNVNTKRTRSLGAILEATSNVFLPKIFDLNLIKRRIECPIDDKYNKYSKLNSTIRK